MALAKYQTRATLVRGERFTILLQAKHGMLEKALNLLHNNLTTSFRGGVMFYGKRGAVPKLFN